MRHHRRISLVGSASLRHSAFLVVVVAHVVVAVVGFGSVAISGVYASRVRHLDQPGALEEARRYFRAPAPAHHAIVAVPFLGAGALALDGSDGGFAQPWVGAALAIWVVAVAVLVAVIRPAQAAVRDLLPGVDGHGRQEGTPTGPTLDPAAVDTLRRSGRRLARGAAGSDLLFAAALVLMIFRPG